MHSGKNAVAVGPGDRMAQGMHRRHMSAMSAQYVLLLARAFVVLAAGWAAWSQADGRSMHLRHGAGRRGTSKKLGSASAAVEIEQAGHSSAGRASDCRQVQLSDGPWFDSGRPDFIPGPIGEVRMTWVEVGRAAADLLPLKGGHTRI